MDGVHLLVALLSSPGRCFIKGMCKRWPEAISCQFVLERLSSC